MGLLSRLFGGTTVEDEEDYEAETYEDDGSQTWYASDDDTETVFYYDD